MRRAPSGETPCRGSWRRGGQRAGSWGWRGGEGGARKTPSLAVSGERRTSGMMTSRINTSETQESEATLRPKAAMAPGDGTPAARARHRVSASCRRSSLIAMLSPRARWTVRVWRGVACLPHKTHVALLSSPRPCTPTSSAQLSALSRCPTPARLSAAHHRAFPHRPRDVRTGSGTRPAVRGFPGPALLETSPACSRWALRPPDESDVQRRAEQRRAYPTDAIRNRARFS